ncbi:MAG: peptidoglycan-associated lipoprotein Pal [Gammaproteobacteria bacterium]|nr:MAG: peptidoglycan-associated lipoprotein Pal [Gammaproteobacteria bacterium]
MLIKKLLKVSVLTAACFSLGACSTADKNELGEMSATPTHADSALTQGAGDVGSFYGDESTHPMQVGNQEYYFDFDKSFVRDEDKPSLQVQAHYLICHPQAKILITGNTDERGSREYNIALGRRRALSVQQFLIANGVNARQILTVSYGAEKPIAFGHTETDYAKNRRADLQYQTPVITDKM